MKYWDVTILITPLIWSIPFSGSSQPNNGVEFKKKSLKDDVEGLMVAREEIERGDGAYEGEFRAHSEALVHYLIAHGFNPNLALLNFRVGYFYLHSTTIQKAIDHFQRALELDSAAHPSIHLLLGRAYHLDEQWDRAITKYEQYRGIGKNTDAALRILANKRIEECTVGNRLVSQPVEVGIVNLG